MKNNLPNFAATNFTSAITANILAACIPSSIQPYMIQSNAHQDALSAPDKIQLEDLESIEALLESDYVDISGDGFVVAVSLHDANTLYVSSGISKSLGYPQDMLIGQSLLSFLYPRDRLTFANHLTQGLQARFSNTIGTKEKLSFYARIREYTGLKNGYSVSGRQAPCKPFELKCSLKDLTLPRTNDESVVQTICFVIVAVPIYPGHKLSREKNPAMTPFSTRHTPNCCFSYVDPASVPFLGYLPQDIVGYSVFDFYHQDDMELMKDIYTRVAKEQGSFCSKPYRFKVFNGDFVLLETEWSSFVNPWSRKFEFIVGQHRIVEGPTNVNVFEDIQKPPTQVDDEAQFKKIQEEIYRLLSLPVKTSQAKASRHQGTNQSQSQRKRRRDLAAHVSKLIENPTVGEEKWSDKVSVLIGEISPHREDSEPSRESPTSFQEQRLHDNIERFFASQTQNNCASFSSGASCSQNQSPDGSGSNDGSRSSSNPKNSSADSAFQSGSCDNREISGETEANGSTGLKHEKFVAFRPALTEEMLAQHDRMLKRQMRNVVSGSGSKSKEVTRKDGTSKLKRQKDGHGIETSSKKQQRIESTGFNVDDLMRQPSFSIQPPFGLTFPVILPTSLCQSCNGNSGSQSTQGQLILPMVPMCALPIPLAFRQVPDEVTGPPQASGGCAPGSKKSVRVQTETCSQDATRHHKNSLRDLVTVLAEGSTGCPSLSSSSFLRSENGTVSEESETVDDVTGSNLNEDKTCEGAKDIQVIFPTAPWLNDIEFNSDIEFRYKINVNELNDILCLEQPDSLKRLLASQDISIIPAQPGANEATTIDGTSPGDGADVSSSSDAATSAASAGDVGVREKRGGERATPATASLPSASVKVEAREISEKSERTKRENIQPSKDSK